MNSKSEFNRSHIPRLIVEVEDENKKAQRLKQEQADKEELDGKQLWWRPGALPGDSAESAR